MRVENAALCCTRQLQSSLQGSYVEDYSDSERSHQKPIATGNLGHTPVSAWENRKAEGKEHTSSKVSNSFRNDAGTFETRSISLNVDKALVLQRNLGTVLPDLSRGQGKARGPSGRSAA